LCTLFGLMRALVVEDSLPIRTAIRDGLAEQGFAVDVAANGEDGLWLAEQNPYDIIVLDIMLPLIDGLEVLRRLRAKGSKVAVLLLTARDTVEDRVTGLDTGADDYLVKPFAFAELLARVRTLVRRRYDAKDPVLRVDDLVIDTVKRRVKRGEAAVALSPREYALLEYLALRAGELVTRTDIWEHVYDFRSDAQSNVVDVYVSYLRKKLGPPSLIHTRRGQGYVLGGEP
jgi:two-component system, OmpR family, copper resistance phosphate regulon response regulator CusR